MIPALAGAVEAIDALTPGDDPAWIDAIRALEELKAIAAAAQARITADFLTSQEDAAKTPRRNARRQPRSMTSRDSVL